MSLLRQQMLEDMTAAQRLSSISRMSDCAVHSALFIVFIEASKKGRNGAVCFRKSCFANVPAADIPSFMPLATVQHSTIYHRPRKAPHRLQS